MTYRQKAQLVVFLIFASCGTSRFVEEFIGGWTEREIGFINSIPQADDKKKYLALLADYKWLGIDAQYFYQNYQPFKWIRNSENILITHNTIKKIGYKKFISYAEYNVPMEFQEQYGGMHKYDLENLSIAQVVDSLIFTYDDSNSDSSYFHKFWNRRRKDKTAQTLISVFKDIKNIYSSVDAEEKRTEHAINDTLENLLLFDLKLQEFNQKPTTDFLWSYFNYLKSIGLSHSAYNLVIERYPGQIQADTVIKILNLHKISEEEYWYKRNSGTWIFTYRDNGP